MTALISSELLVNKMFDADWFWPLIWLFLCCFARGRLILATDMAVLCCFDRGRLILATDMADWFCPLTWLLCVVLTEADWFWLLTWQTGFVHWLGCCVLFWQRQTDFGYWHGCSVLFWQRHWFWTDMAVLCCFDRGRLILATDMAVLVVLTEADWFWLLTWQTGFVHWLGCSVCFWFWLLTEALSGSSRTTQIGELLWENFFRMVSRIQSKSVLFNCLKQARTQKHTLSAQLTFTHRNTHTHTHTLTCMDMVYTHTHSIWKWQLFYSVCVE